MKKIQAKESPTNEEKEARELDENMAKSDSNKSKDSSGRRGDKGHTILGEVNDDSQKKRK